MIFGDVVNRKSSDRDLAAEMPAERWGPKQIVVWGCLIGATVGAVALTAQNVSILASDHGNACTMSERWGTAASGRVLGFLSNDRASSLMVATQEKLHATINPAYVANKRAVVLVSGSGGVRHITALVPAGMSVQVGDQVDFASGYRDRSLPCSYVPNLISRTGATPKSE